MARNFGSIQGYNSISGRVKLDYGRLDSGRRQYLNLENAEPNLGLPDSDGYIVLSDVNGTRYFTDTLSLGGLSFKPNSLDSADSGDFFALFLKGDPFDGTVDSVGIRRVNEGFFEVDTLDTVTSRGDSTNNAITVGGFNSLDASFLQNVNRRATELVLYLDPTTGEIVAEAPEAGTGALSRIQTTSTDSDFEFNLVFKTSVDGIDSAFADTSLTYNAFNNRITSGRLRLTDLEPDSSSNRYMVLDDSDNVRFKTLGALSGLDSETDTLQTVTNRGNITNQSVVVNGLTTNAGLFDGSGRQLIIYDSAGGILWG